MTVDTAAAKPSLFSRILHNWLTRFLILFVALMAVYAASQIVPGEMAKTHPKAMKDTFAIAGALIGVPVVMLAYIFLTKLLERWRPLTELAPGPALPQFAIGALLGFVLLSVVIGIIVVIGHGSIAVPATFTFPIIAFAVSMISGFAEELLFRGVMFRLIEERWGTFVALLISSAFFGAAHAANPNATLVSSVAIALEAGLLLGLPYTATRKLWLPIGLHFGWNFTEGGIFTTVVSGGKIPGILQTNLTGPDLLTGGAFGPEASIVTVIVCLIAAAYFLWLTIRRGEWRRFTARKAAAG